MPDATSSITPARSLSNPIDVATISSFRARLESSRSTRVPPPPASPPQSPDALGGVRSAYLRHMLPSLRCPICIRSYSDGHRANILVPCGHNVCEASTSRLSRCPICRSSIETTVPNRELMTVLEIANKSLTPPKENCFLASMRKHCATLESIRNKREMWTASQVNAVSELVSGMKKHAEDVDDDWIDATGLDAHVTNFLHRKLTTLNRILRHRARLGWTSNEDLPMLL